MRTHLPSNGDIVLAQVHLLREHGFADVPLPSLVYPCVDGRVLFRRHEAVTDVVLVRARDAAVAMRFHNPTARPEGHQLAVIRAWRGEIVAVVGGLLNEFYRYTEPPTVSNIAPAVLAWMAES